MTLRITRSRTQTPRCDGQKEEIKPRTVPNVRLTWWRRNYEEWLLNTPKFWFEINQQVTTSWLFTDNQYSGSTLLGLYRWIPCHYADWNNTHVHSSRQLASCYCNRRGLRLASPIQSLGIRWVLKQVHVTIVNLDFEIRGVRQIL